MAEPKTQKTSASVKDFIAAVPDEQRRKDAAAISKMLAEVTGEKAAMWGTSIVGFGSYESATGRWPIVGFSPRKTNLVLYLMPEFEGREGMLARLGRHKTGTSCLYLNRLADVDAKVLRELVAKSVAAMREKHG